MERLGLQDKVSIFEYHNKTLSWLVMADYRAVELAYKSKMIDVKKEVLNSVKERKAKKDIKVQEYYVADSIMRGVFRQRSILSI